MRPHLIKPDATSPSGKRVPLAARVVQVLRATQALHAKRVDVFGTRALCDEIDARMNPASITPAVYALVEHNVLKCTTPLKKKSRRYMVESWDRLVELLTALEAHDVETERVLLDTVRRQKSSGPPDGIDARSVAVSDVRPARGLRAWLLRPMLLRLDRIIARQQRIEGRLDELLAEWRGQSAKEGP